MSSSLVFPHSKNQVSILDVNSGQPKTISLHRLDSSRCSPQQIDDSIAFHVMGWRKDELNNRWKDHVTGIDTEFSCLPGAADAWAPSLDLNQAIRAADEFNRRRCRMRKPGDDRFPVPLTYLIGSHFLTFFTLHTMTFAVQVDPAVRGQTAFRFCQGLLYSRFAILKRLEPLSAATSKEENQYLGLFFDSDPKNKSQRPDDAEAEVDSIKDIMRNQGLTLILETSPMATLKKPVYHVIKDTRSIDGPWYAPDVAGLIDNGRAENGRAGGPSMSKRESEVQQEELEEARKKS